MFSFLFGTWLGGVLCSFIVLVAVGTPVVNWINKEKNRAIAEGHKLRDELRKHKI